MFNYAVQARARGLSNCSGLGALTLSLNKANYVVGESPAYSVSGAQPDKPLAWTSTRNGLPTGEFNSDYGQKTDALGVWSGAGGAWTPDQAGYWTKSVAIGGEVDTKSFQVLPAAGASNVSGGGTVYTLPAGATQQGQQAQPGFFEGDVDLFGVKVPKALAYGGGALVIYMLLRKK